MTKEDYVTVERDEKGYIRTMHVTLRQYPTDDDWMLFKEALRITAWKDAANNLPSSELIRNVLKARHSPCRLLNYTFRIDGIPSNIATHLCRHVHALPFVSSLRNDRQDFIDGDEAPRNTPVNMLYRVNAEELMVIANKRLCNMASEKTREVVRQMCDLAEQVTPEFHGLLVPMCKYCGGVCHEIHGCGKCTKG